MRVSETLHKPSKRRAGMLTKVELLTRQLEVESCEIVWLAKGSLALRGSDEGGFQTSDRTPSTPQID